MKMLKNITLGLLIAFTVSTISYAPPRRAPLTTVAACQARLAAGDLYGAAKAALEKKLEALQVADQVNGATQASWLSWAFKPVTWTLKYGFIGEYYIVKHLLKSIRELMRGGNKFSHELAWTVIAIGSTLIATHILQNAPELANELASILVNLLEWVLPTAAISNRIQFLSSAISIIVNLTSAGYSKLILPALQIKLNALKTAYEYAIAPATAASEIYNGYKEDIQICDNRWFFKRWFTSRESCLQEAGVPERLW